MRHKLLFIAILLLSAAWAVAQEPSTTSPGAPAAGTNPQTQSTMPGEPGQATSPNAPSAGQMPTSGEPDIIEGCLGGAAPNFTVTDKTGTTYKLGIPDGADASVLTKHIGESVQVLGAVNDSKSMAGGTADSSSAGKGKTIAVQKIGRGKGTCPAAPGAEKPPTK